MISIGEILESLTPAERDRLKYAFEHNLEQFVAIDGGTRFVGVNCSKVPILKVERAVGLWSTGTIEGEYK